MGSGGCSARDCRCVKSLMAPLLSGARLFPPTSYPPCLPQLMDSTRTGWSGIPHKETEGWGHSNHLWGHHTMAGQSCPMYRAPTRTVSSDIYWLLTHSVKAPRKLGGMGSLGEMGGGGLPLVRASTLSTSQVPQSWTSLRNLFQHQHFGPGLVS